MQEYQPAIQSAATRKKVLILGHNDATQFIDIYNQYTQLFDQNQYAVTVAYLTNNPNPETIERTLTNDIIFLNIPKRNIRGLKIKAITTLLALCKEKKFDLIICHRYKPTYIMMWVAQFCRIPALIFVMHELGTMNMLHRKILTACLTRKNMLFAGVSNAVKNDMQQHLWGLPAKTVTTLYNSIDMVSSEQCFLSKSAARHALSLPDDAILFGNLARLAYNKDHATLIQAFSLLKPVCPLAKLVIIGDGQLEPALKEQVTSLGLNHDVIFTGYLPTAFRYLKAFDCFVLTSRQEAFGRVLIEAMTAKLPIIATRVHGIPEVLGDVGTLISAENSQACAAAMQKIYHLSAAERETLGNQAYQHVLAKFSLSAFHHAFWQQPLIKTMLG
jgi:glycosyltransferase involved in cell wall biosynthesis